MPASIPNPVRGAIWPLVGIALLVVFNTVMDVARIGGILTPGAFLHLSWRDGAPAGALIDVLNYGAMIAIVALGMAPVLATRGVDLSVGSIAAIAGAVAAELVVAGQPSLVAVAAAMAAAVACGLWNGVLVTVFRLQPFVATLVLMVAGRGIAQMITGSQITTFHDPLIEYIGLGRPAWLPLPFSFLLAVGLFVGAGLTLRWSALGLLLEAVGGNPEAARLSGVRSRLIVAATYVLSGACAGVAGLIAVANIKGADPFHAGQNLELAAIFAAVAGGTPLTGGRFSLRGAFMGGLLMQCLITTMYARNIAADVAPLPQAIVILLVCVMGSARVRGWLQGRRATP
jgi:ribose/xylose/arabinose/galactoside ABC-type transport system permease subunit